MRKQLQELDATTLRDIVNEMVSWDGYNEDLQFYEMETINEIYYNEPLEVVE